MPRAYSGVVRKNRAKKIFKRAKGFFGGRSKIYKMANEAVYRAWANEYIGRKQRKRDLRQLWNARINAGARLEGLSYSTFIYGLKKAGVVLNRKMLAELAVSDSATFKAVVDLAKTQLKK